MRNIDLAKSASCLWTALASIAVLMGVSSPVHADTIEDYLVQQVCMDANGTVTSEDPLYCPGRARKLQPGESLPYHKWDMPQQSNLAQISDSYPLVDMFGRVRVVSNFFFTRAGTVPYFAPGNSADGDSAYDLFVTDGAYASAAGTYDAGGGWQPFWRNAQCGLADSWVIAPKALSVPFGQGQTITTLSASFPQCPTVDQFAPSLTVWNYYPDHLYQSGKRIPTIKSWHFSEGSVDSNQIEVFMFTKEYGKTKWEAWESAANRPQGPDPFSVTHCGVGTNNGVVQFGSTTYYLAACHDWSFIFPADNGGWSPANFHIDPLYLNGNLLKNTHMKCTTSSGLTRFCGQPGNLCRQIAPWQRFGDLNWTFNQNPQGTNTPYPRLSANCSLKFSMPSGFTGQSIYQDTTPQGEAYTSYSYGAALRAPLGAGSATSPLTLAIFELNAAGAVVATHTVPVNAGRSYRFFEGSFDRHPSADHFRFQVYVGSTNTEYEITDAWLTPLF